MIKSLINKNMDMLKLMEEQNDFIYESLKKAQSRVEQGGVMAEVEFQRGVVIFKDAGNRMDLTLLRLN
jgi:hypothetical protein